MYHRKGYLNVPVFLIFNKTFCKHKHIQTGAIWSMTTMTSWNGNTFCVTGPFSGEFTGHWWIPQHKDQWRGALIFLSCTWTNGWANNRNANDLRRHRAHYDVTVMYCPRHMPPLLSFDQREYYSVIHMRTLGCHIEANKNGFHFADGIFKLIFSHSNDCILNFT